MAKNLGLSNSLLGKRIKPKEGFGDPRHPHDPNGRWWADLKPSLDGTYTAEIDAAWTEEGSVKVSAHDPWGNSAEFYMKYVALVTQ